MHTQVVVPFVTESYGSTRDPPEQSIPICTLKNFPYQIEHTIQWAREQFEGYFKTAPTEVNGYLTDANYLTELAKQPNTQTETLKGLHASLVGERPLTFDQCIQWARLKFEEEYHQKIAQLLFNYPVDSLNSEGGRFWSGTKRAPAPLQFDSTDATHMMFVVAAARLRAHLYGLQSHGDVQAYQAVLNAMHVEPYVPRGGVKIATTEADAKQPAAIENMTDLQTEVKALGSYCLDRS
jgi:ubiquitin-activating enzyme E1